MIALLKFLIFGPQCNHEWEKIEEITPWANDQKFLFCCKKCGKFKKQRLHVIGF